MEKSEFIAALTDELARTRTTAKDLRRMSGPVAPDVAIGRISRMDAINNKAVNDAALRKAEEKLELLERMTGQVDAPGFGLCKRCGNRIPSKRLLLMPHSSHCVGCAAKI